MNAEIAEIKPNAATTKKVFEIPNQAMQKVDSAGPMAKPAANRPSWIEFARSSVILAGPATSGTSDFLAVLPPGAVIARKMPIAISAGRVSSQSQLTSGMSSETNTVSNSARTAIFLLPNRSMIEPMTGAIKSPGIAVAATTNPALAALPVISRAIHGTAMKTIEPEITLATLAN